MVRRKISQDLIEYDVGVRFRGFPAYAIRELVETGLYGTSEEEVVENLVSGGIARELKSGLLGKLDITLEEAKKKNYIPVKPNPEEGEE